MTPRHIFDAQGRWVVFVVGPDVFLRDGEWLGNLSANNEIRDRKGRLMGALDRAGRVSLSGGISTIAAA
ncbi:MAG TPA: hypothetical protein VI702_03925 [Nitrospiria bacterium]